MQYIIKNDKVGIRTLEESDKLTLLKWLSDERVLTYWEGKSSIFNLDRINNDFYLDPDTSVNKHIIELYNKPIGYLQFYKLDKNGFIEYNYPETKQNVYGLDLFIGEPNFWDKGFGTMFLKLILNYLTKEKLANSVIVDPHLNNSRAIRCYEKVGFKKIKFLPKHELHDNILVDCVLMEYINQELNN